MINKNKDKLTRRDLDIMNILWNSSRPLTALEITKTNESLSSNTVQSILRKLLNKEFIEVADIVYSGTVLCRSYKAVISASDYALNRLTTDFKILSEEVSATSLVAAILDIQPDSSITLKTIDELESLLKEYKKSLN